MKKDYQLFPYRKQNKDYGSWIKGLMPMDKADSKAVTDIMGYPIAWAPGMLLKAGGYETLFNKKA